MKQLFSYQKSKGGIIDIEAEENKLLLITESTDEGSGDTNAVSYKLIYIYNPSLKTLKTYGSKVSYYLSPLFTHPYPLFAGLSYSSICASLVNNILFSMCDLAFSLHALTNVTVLEAYSVTF